MSTAQYNTLDKLKVGVDDYKIKVRVIRLWRGSTRTGEEFKNFNLLLLDHKVSTYFHFSFCVMSIIELYSTNFL